MDNAQINFAKGEPNFRGIVIEGEFEPPYVPNEAILSQQRYIGIEPRSLQKRK